MTAANILTLLRLLATVPVFILVYTEGVPAAWAALGVFALAMLTDVFDGMLARRAPGRSTLGNYLDPVADKVLILSVFICLAIKQIVPAWAVVLLVAREFAVDGVRAAGALQGRLVGANWMGKTKTMLETITVLFALCGLALQASSIATFGPTGVGPSGLHDVLWLVGRDLLGLAWWLAVLAALAAAAFALIFVYWNREVLRVVRKG